MAINKSTVSEKYFPQIHLEHTLRGHCLPYVILGKSDIFMQVKEVDPSIK
jgi:hypothetical protein